MIGRSSEVYFLSGARHDAAHSGLDCRNRKKEFENHSFFIHKLKILDKGTTRHSYNSTTQIFTLIHLTIHRQNFDTSLRKSEKPHSPHHEKHSEISYNFQTESQNRKPTSSTHEYSPSTEISVRKRERSDLPTVSRED